MNEGVVGWLRNPIYTDNIVSGTFDVFHSRPGMIDEFKGAKTPEKSFGMCKDLSRLLKAERMELLRSDRRNYRHHFGNIPGESDSLLCSSSRTAMSDFFASEISCGRLDYESDLRTDGMQFIDGRNCVEWLQFLSMAGEWETHFLALTATAVNCGKDGLDKNLPEKAGEFIERMLLPAREFIIALDQLCDNEQRPPALPDDLKSEIRKNIEFLREKLEYFMGNRREISAEEAIVALKTMFVAVAGVLSGVESFLFGGSSSVNSDVARIRKQVYKVTGPKEIAVYARAGGEL